MARDPWAAYVPTTAAPWDRSRVHLLHRRAGFAATPEMIRRDLADGPEASLGRVLGGRVREGIVADDFESTAAVLADAAVASGDPARLKAWWIFRMIAGPDPLGERLALLWHDHFATSNAKVDDLGAIRRQNDTFRRLGRAPFRALLDESLRQPALLVWLDAPSNRKGHPNENLARELLELFTLGIGHYTEDEVKECARALTGWTTRDGRFSEIPAQHDDGEKTILGRRDRWSAPGLIQALAEHPATATRIALKLCGLFLGEGAVDPEGVEALAAGLRARDLDVGWAVATILRSRAFFVPEHPAGRVLGPIEFVIGSATALGRLDPPPSTLMLADWSARLGQDLFYPPNVGGWPGGRSWLSGRGTIGRANYAAALVAGPAVGIDGPLDAGALADREGDGDPIVAACRLLLSRDPAPPWRDRIAAALGAAPATERARIAFVMALASPEAQLG